jgi:hypothetical protein
MPGVRPGSIAIPRPGRAAPRERLGAPAAGVQHPGIALRLGRVELTRAWLGKLLVALSLAAVACAVHLVNSAFIEGSALNFSSEGSVPTIITGAIFLAAGIVAVVAARRREAERPAWIAIAVIMIAFSAEELQLQLHDRLEDLLSIGLANLVLAVLGLVLVAWSWRFLVDLAAPTPLLLVCAVVLLAASQGAGMLATEVVESGNLHDLLVLLEEGGEATLGALVLAAAWIAATEAGGGVRARESAA